MVKSQGIDKLGLNSSGVGIALIVFHARDLRLGVTHGDTQLALRQPRAPPQVLQHRAKGCKRTGFLFWHAYGVRPSRVGILLRYSDQRR